MFLTADHEHGDVILCAVRYCFGRRTYMPGRVIGWCKRHWAEIDRKTRRQIHRDVRVELDRAGILPGRLGAEANEGAWREFLSWMDREAG